mmetsp:Transcript_23094/g.50273  ORF Transcript_23094/g.50273 Transcript_23094/m.50273 type:complete len:117 (-) Transcript_23094:182-532(-)
MAIKQDFYERNMYTAVFAKQRWPRMVGVSVLDRPVSFSRRTKIIGILAPTDRPREILGPCQARVVGEHNRWLGHSFFKVEYSDEEGEKTRGYVCKRFIRSEPAKLGGGKSVKAMCF